MTHLQNWRWFDHDNLIYTVNHTTPLLYYIAYIGIICVYAYIGYLF